MNRILLAACAAIVLALPTTVEAGPRASVSGKLSAQQDDRRVMPVPCNGVAACNNIISYCAEKGGNWRETSHNGKGQPNKGVCYLN